MWAILLRDPNISVQNSNEYSSKFAVDVSVRSFSTTEMDDMVQMHTFES